MDSYLCSFNIEISLEKPCGSFLWSFNIEISLEMVRGFLPLIIQYRDISREGMWFLSLFITY